MPADLQRDAADQALVDGVLAGQRVARQGDHPDRVDAPDHSSARSRC
jgi:hypothetical protein